MNPRQKANAKYNLKAYDRLELNTFKGNKEIIKAYCKNKNISVNSLINKLLYDELKKDGYILFTEPTTKNQ